MTFKIKVFIQLHTLDICGNMYMSFQSDITVYLHYLEMLDLLHNTCNVVG